MSAASGFYKQLGFKHVVDFDSPLHNLATPGGQACIYEYAVEPPSLAEKIKMNAQQQKDHA